MKYNMISDNFVFETPQATPRRPVPLSDRDVSTGRLSTGSFVSPSLNENFGDWGFNAKDKAFSLDDDIEDPEYKIEAASADYPFSLQKNDANNDEDNGFKVKSVPKLPVSSREIRKVNLHNNQAPVIIFDADDDNEVEDDFLISPMGFTSPISNAIEMHRQHVQPTRHVMRSVSDVGKRGKSKAMSSVSNKVDDNFRESWKDKQTEGGEMSLSFSHRRRPNSNRELLKQIGERRKSYRDLNLAEDEGDHKYDVDIEFSEVMINTGDNIDDVLQDPMMDDDEIYEGTIPLKTSPTVTNKKRSSSKNRIRKKNSLRPGDESPYFDEFGLLRPTRKSSYGSRSSASGSGTSYYSKTRKPSLSDSDRKSSRNTESTEATSSTNGVGSFSSDPERQSFLDDVRARRQKNQKRTTEKENKDSIPRRSSRRNVDGGGTRKSTKLKKTSNHNKKAGSEEFKKTSSRGSSRRPIGRRASISMTGNIVDNQSHNRRRSSMDHWKEERSPSPRKPKSKRRATMDHIQLHSPSRNQSPSDHLKNSKLKPPSRTDLSDHVVRTNFPSSVPFGEEGTETTQDTSDTRNTPTRKSSVTSREREAPRRTRSSDEKLKSLSSRRKIGRNRSDLGRQKERFGKKDCKSVSVEEILALVATTEISVGDKLKRLRSCDQLKGASVTSRGVDIDQSGRGSTGSSSKASSRDSRERFREKSTDEGRQKNSRSRSGRDTSRSASFRFRKGKRVDAQPEKESFSLDDSPGKKKKTVVLGKESRRHPRNRRGSNR